MWHNISSWIYVITRIAQVNTTFLLRRRRSILLKVWGHCYRSYCWVFFARYDIRRCLCYDVALIRYRLTSSAVEIIHRGTKAPKFHEGTFNIYWVKGLNKIVEHIEYPALQCPAEFRSDENKYAILVVLVSHTNGPSHRFWPLSIMKTKFHALVIALHEINQLSEDLNNRMSTSFQTHIPELDDECAVESFFQGY